MIQRVREILDRLGAQYAVIGAMAMAARGYPRFTLDSISSPRTRLF